MGLSGDVYMNLKMGRSECIVLGSVLLLQQTVVDLKPMSQDEIRGVRGIHP